MPGKQGTADSNHAKYHQRPPCKKSASGFGGAEHVRHRFPTIPATLAALNVNPGRGLTNAEADARRREHGYNEVAVQKRHPLLMFLGKFWGLSAWMLELIIVLSAALRKYSDLAVVGALLVVNGCKKRSYR